MSEQARSETATPETPVIRPFRRADRDQLTALVNRHVRAVVPGVAVTVHTVLAQLEREPEETVVDPWVSARQPLVAELRGAVVAAALLLRYDDGPHVGPGYRGAGEVRWLVCATDAPFQPGAQLAGVDLARASIAWLRASGADPILADGALPAPGVYGIPQQWPHIARILEAAGFVAGESEEWIHLAEVARLVQAAGDRIADGTAPADVERTLGVNGTRWTAFLPGSGQRGGYIEVDVLSGDIGRVAAGGAVADVGNLWLADPGDEATARALLGQAARWLRLAGVDLLLAYTGPADPAADPEALLLRRMGFEPLTRTRRDWRLPDPPASPRPDRPGGTRPRQTSDQPFGRKLDS